MRDVLENVLRAISRPAIAVSGGVDSVTLAAVANRLCNDVVLMHAMSPAVPAEATMRVRRLAAKHGWHLQVFEAGEFADAAYRANPVNRCFYCKTNLYGAIRARTDRPILSGANLDDLGEYRPGLDAARLHEVRHPYIEAGVTKDAVRQIARELALDDVAELPSSPCLSSRIETGIRIEPEALAFIARVEHLLTQEIHPATVRCRIRSAAVVIELDATTLGKLTAEETARLSALIAQQSHLSTQQSHLRTQQTYSPSGLPVSFEQYRNGSAFLRERPA
jgi:uncharacterized protein